MTHDVHIECNNCEWERTYRDVTYLSVRLLSVWVQHALPRFHNLSFCPASSTWEPSDQTETSSATDDSQELEIAPAAADLLDEINECIDEHNSRLANLPDVPAISTLSYDAPPTERTVRRVIRQTRATRQRLVNRELDAHAEHLTEVEQELSELADRLERPSEASHPSQYPKSEN